MNLPFEADIAVCQIHFCPASPCGGRWQGGGMTEDWVNVEEMFVKHFSWSRDLHLSTTEPTTVPSLPPDHHPKYIRSGHQSKSYELFVLDADYAPLPAS